MLSAVIRNGHSYRAVPLAGQLVHHRSAHPGPLVLGATSLNSPARTLDRDRTVSQRSEPSSRTALMGEQPNPWEVLPPQDATSRHRGAKPRRRCERLGVISLLSTQPEGTFGRLRYLLGGDRPSQTAHLAMSGCRITDSR